jgi:hypothetical protein
LKAPAASKAPAPTPPADEEEDDDESYDEEDDEEDDDYGAHGKRARGKAPKRKPCGECSGCLWRAGRGKHDAKCGQCYACAHPRLNRACRFGACEKTNSRYRIMHGVLQEPWYNAEEAAYDATGLEPTAVGVSNGFRSCRYSDLPVVLQQTYDQLTDAQRGGARRAAGGGGRHAPSTPAREGRAGGDEAAMRETITETITDCLDRLADLLDPNTGLVSVATSLDNLVRLMDRGRDAAALAAPNLTVQAELTAELATTCGELTETRGELTETRAALTATRGELTATQGRVTALEELVRARDTALTSLNEVVRRLSAVEDRLVAPRGGGGAAAGGEDGEGDEEEDEESEPEPETRPQRGKRRK